MKAPKVLPIVEDAPKEMNRELHPNIPQPPTLLTVYGSIKAGKSTILSNLFLSDDFMRGYFDRIFWFSQTILNDKTSRFLCKEENIDTFSEYSDELLRSIIQMMDAEDPDEKDTVAIVFDDILGSIKRESYANYLATRFRHHLPNGLLVFSSQNYKSIPPIVRNNQTAVIICKQHNIKELKKMEEEFDGMFHGNFLQLYREAVLDHPYSFLLLKLDQNPCEAWVCYERQIYPKSGMETGDDVTNVREEVLKDQILKEVL